MSNKNNSPEQKAAWEANKNIGSPFIRVIPAPLYLPPIKMPSRRDLHRARVRGQKLKNK